MEQVKVFASVLVAILLKWSGEELNVVEGESELCEKVCKFGVRRCYSSSLKNNLTPMTDFKEKWFSGGCCP